jgi:hypothetical protein
MFLALRINGTEGEVPKINVKNALLAWYAQKEAIVPLLAWWFTQL